MENKDINKYVLLHFDTVNDIITNTLENREDHNSMENITFSFKLRII